MQTCIVPVISFNYAARNIERCKKILTTAIGFGLALMIIGTLCFNMIPTQMLQVFTADTLVIDIGSVGFRIIGISFIPMVTSLIFPVFFQAVGSSLKSSFLTVVRTVVLFVPLGFWFSRLGLKWFWMTFPVTEVITSAVGLLFYRQFLASGYVQKERHNSDTGHGEVKLKKSKPGMVITIAREHGSSGKQIGRLVAESLGIPFYYKEMIALAAHESGLDKEFISDIHKNAPNIMHDLYLSTQVIQHAIAAQDKIIHKIAAEGSCVIVGKSADYVLKNYDNVFRIFIHAPKEYRINRVMEVYGDSRKEAERNIRRSDKARGAYYRYISARQWGAKENYELIIDSSCGVERAADIILEYVSNHKAG